MWSVNRVYSFNHINNIIINFANPCCANMPTYHWIVPTNSRSSMAFECSKSNYILLFCISALLSLNKSARFVYFRMSISYCKSDDGFVSSTFPTSSGPRILKGCHCMLPTVKGQSNSERRKWITESFCENAAIKKNVRNALIWTIVWGMMCLW